MRKLRALWRSGLPPRLREELEAWITAALAIGAALMLYVTLKAELAPPAMF